MSPKLTAGPRSADLRQGSRFAVLREIYAHTTPSRHELARDTGLSFATVATIVNELIAVGMLVDAGREDSAGGRPRGRLRVSPDRGVLVGVEVAETYVEVDVFDAALARLDRRREEINEASDPRELTGIVAANVTAALAGQSDHEVLGVGVSLPGPVSRSAGVSVFDPHWQWRDVPIKALLEQRLGMPVQIDNPLKAITLAEMWFGAHRSAQSLVAVYLGTGVGCGVALNGQMIRGATNTAGEWGHTLLMMDGRGCRCGRRGCVEAYVGAPGLMETMRSRDPDHPALGDGQLRFVQQIARDLAAGDPQARWLIDQLSHHLGSALADLVNLVNPDVLVLCGWLVEELGEEILEATRRRMADESLGGAATGARLVTTSLVDPVGLGMATLALERFLAGVGLPSRSLGQSM